jgi:hypothetical protein
VDAFFTLVACPAAIRRSRRAEFSGLAIVPIAKLANAENTSLHNLFR